jgi:hypothetical protein
MIPDIFMNDFERTIWGDEHYSVIGRALTVATRFESLCRALNTLLKIRGNNNILDSEIEVTKFAKRLYKIKLSDHISSIAGKEEDLKSILEKGRLARNEIAHEITNGLACCLDTLPSEHIKCIMSRLHALIIDLAEADRAVSLIISVLTLETLPTNEFLTNYPHLIAKWVEDID